MRKPWTDKQVSLLKKHYATTPGDKLVKLIGRDIESIYNKAHSLGLKRDPEFLRAINRQLGKRLAASPAGKKTRFYKGQESWNQGNHGVRMSPKSEFKKGHLPYNTLHDGAITIRTDRNPKTGYTIKYKYIRIAKAKWELYHRHIWKQHHGAIPPKHVVCFKDGDQMNCHIDNLECISMAENRKRNDNREKFSQTMRLKHEEEGYDPFGNRRMTDSWVAQIIADGDKDLKQQILEKHQDLIAVKRAQLQLNRQIKQHEKNSQ
jgi:hypothetical protein